MGGVQRQPAKDCSTDPDIDSTHELVLILRETLDAAPPSQLDVFRLFVLAQAIEDKLAEAAKRNLITDAFAALAASGAGETEADHA